MNEDGQWQCGRIAEESGVEDDRGSAGDDGFGWAARLAQADPLGQASDNSK